MELKTKPSHLCTQKKWVKSKKGKQSPFQKKPTKSATTWPDLPTQLLTILAKNSTLMQNISYGGNVTKSYILPPKQCNPTGKSPFPQLSICDDGQTNQCRDKSQYLPDVFNVTFHVGHLWWFGRWPPCRYFCDNFVGYSQGMLVCRRRVELSEYHLWDPIDGSHRMLPLWDITVPFKHVTLSSSPKDCNSSCTVMVLTGIQKPAFAFCDMRGCGFAFCDRRRCKCAWFKQDSTLVEPYSSNHQPMQFTNAIAFKGKFYVFSLQGTLAVMEKIDSHFSITSFSTNRAVPRVPSMHFKEYLVESNGEILLVFLISRKSIHSVENVEVYRLRFNRLSWVKMERIGDRTLFVGANCCISLNAGKMGCRENCIYFSYETVEEWWVYDMERGSILPGWKNSNSTTKSPEWDEPI